MKKLFTVSADHVSPRFALNGATVECRTNDDGETWYAVLPGFGCGRSLEKPESAVRALLAANGCKNIRIAEMALELDAFRATRVETANQFIYDKGLYIDKGGNAYSLIISNQEWSGLATAEYLAKLESVLYYMHYLPECHADMMLSSDAEGAANIDAYIRGFCDANGYECDGDAFGVMFSGKEEWSAAETFQQALATVRIYKLSSSSRFWAFMDGVKDNAEKADYAAPLLDMGFSVFHTGGGCTAWGLDLGNEWQLLITNGDLSHDLSDIDSDYGIQVGLDHCDADSIGTSDLRNVADAIFEANAYRLALRFAQFLRHDIADVTRWNSMLRKNMNAAPGICASHDYCDANMTMLAAFRDSFNRSPVMMFETEADGTPSDEAIANQAAADVALWNHAWNLAKENFLTASRDMTPIAAVEYDESLWADDWNAEKPATLEDGVNAKMSALASALESKADERPMNAPYAIRVSWNGLIVMKGVCSGVIGFEMMRHMLEQFAGDTRANAKMPTLEHIQNMKAGEKATFDLGDETGLASVELTR